MKKKILFFLSLFLLSSNFIYSQIDNSRFILKGIVENESNNDKMSGVHIINLNQVYGVITDSNGEFTIPVNINDTIYFSYIGFKPLKIPVKKRYD
ncbi:MAG: carboxypeptidase-like regulatory domain-containing protein [Flavobacteriaceae bacterium]